MTKRYFYFPLLFAIFGAYLSSCGRNDNSILQPEMGSEYGFALKWGKDNSLFAGPGHGDGTSGSDLGAFNEPSGIFCFGNYVFVADTKNNRIQKFDLNGNSISFGASAGYINGNALGEEGSGAGQFYAPLDISVDNQGSIYIVEAGNPRVQKFLQDGAPDTLWGVAGVVTNSLYFKNPVSVALDSYRNLYVLDRVDSSILKFSNNGIFLSRWGNKGFINPGAISSGADNRIYVADTGNHRICVLSPNGVLTHSFGNFGYRMEDLNGPLGIVIDAANNIFIVDGNCLKKFSNDGKFITGIGNTGVRNGEFMSPRDVAIGTSGDIYIADTLNHRIQKFAAHE